MSFATHAIRTSRHTLLRQWIRTFLIQALKQSRYVPVWLNTWHQSSLQTAVCCYLTVANPFARQTLPSCPTKCGLGARINNTFAKIRQRPLGIAPTRNAALHRLQSDSTTCLATLRDIRVTASSCFLTIIAPPNRPIMSNTPSKSLTNNFAKRSVAKWKDPLNAIACTTLLLPGGHPRHWDLF